jgi:hypothetical protein
MSAVASTGLALRFVRVVHSVILLSSTSRQDEIDELTRVRIVVVAIEGQLYYPGDGHGACARETASNLRN